MQTQELEAKNVSPSGYQKELVQQVVAQELGQYLAGFENEQYAIRKLSAEAGVTSKTIKRILNLENFPTYQTVFKLFAVIYGTANESVIFNKAPLVIRKYIEHKNPNCLKDCFQLDVNLFELMNQNPIIAELIVLAGINDLNLSTVAFKYGEYGLNSLNRLVEQKVFIPISKDVYALSPHLPHFDAKTIKYVGNWMVERFSKPEQTEVADKNIIAFFAEGLNEEGLKKWVEIDSEAFHRKIQLASTKKYQGAIPSFTFTATDTLSSDSLWRKKQ